MNDFFLTDKDKLWLWVKTKKLFSSVDVLNYKHDNFSLRADRTIRNWAEPKEKTGVEPRLRSLTREEKLFKGLWKMGEPEIAWYCVVEK